MASGGKVIVKIDGDTKNFKKKFDNLKGYAGKAAKGIGIAFGAASTAITTGLGAAIKAGADFEAQMSTVGAISGASADNMELLGAKAKEMGIKTKFSATEAGQAMEYMAMAGWKTEDMLNGVEGIMNLAAASGEDLAAVSDIVTDAMTAFGLAADQSGRFADVLAAASSNSNTNVGLMGETFKYVAPVAGAMKFSIEDTAVAIGLMANAGIKGSQAGTALRSTLSRLAKPPKEAAEAMDALHLSVTNSDGSFKSFSQIISEIRDKFGKLDDSQKTMYASMLGGQEAMSGLLAIVNASDSDFNKLTEAINASAGSAEKMANIKLDNLQGQITLLKSSLEGLGVAIYESNNTTLTGAVELVKEYVNQLTDAFNNGGFSGLIEQAGVILGDIAVKIAEQAPTLIEAAENLITSFITALSENDEQIASAAFEIINAFINAVVNLFPEIVNLGVSLLSALYDGMWQEAPAITTIVTALVSAFAAFKTVTFIQTLLPTLIGFVQGFNMLKDAISLAAVKQAVLNTVMSLNPVGLVIAGITALVATLVVLWNKSEAFRNFWIGVWEGIKSAVVTAAQFIIQNWKQVTLFLVNPIAGAIALLYKLNPKFKAWVDNLITKIKGWISNIKEVGIHMVTGIWDGFKSKFSGMINKIKGLIDLIPASIKKVLGIHSPSTVMRDEIGKMIDLGIAEGIEENTKAIEDVIKEQKQTIVDTYKSMAEAAIDSIDEVAKAQETFAKKLKDWGNLYTTDTYEIGGVKYSVARLADLEKQSEKMEDYTETLLQLKARGDIPAEFFNILKEEMSLDESLMFAKGLLAASDEEFTKYINSWKKIQTSADTEAKFLYADETQKANEEISKKFDDFNSDIEQKGKDNAAAWGEGFFEKIREVMPEIRSRIEESLKSIAPYSGFIPSMAGGNVTNISNTYNLPGGEGQTNTDLLAKLKNFETLQKARGGY